MMKVVISKPVVVANSPVTATAPPSRAMAIKARRCSDTTASRNTAVNARKPGISRIDCSKPMSLPSNAAISMAKLFSSAFHVA